MFTVSEMGSALRRLLMSSFRVLESVQSFEISGEAHRMIVSFSALVFDAPVRYPDDRIEPKETEIGVTAFILIVSHHRPCHT